MKNITYLSRSIVERESSAKASGKMALLQQAEKMTFPRNEAFDFDTKSRKRNTAIIVVSGCSEPKGIVLYAYLVLRPKVEARSTTQSLRAPRLSCARHCHRHARVLEAQVEEYRTIDQIGPVSR